MRNNNIYVISDFPNVSKKGDLSLSDAADYGAFNKRIDSLEERLTGKIDILVSRNNIRADKKRSISLGVSAFIAGVSFVLMVLSVQGLVEIGWQFWAAIFFSSSGLSIASLLILIGVDYDEYEERD